MGLVTIQATANESPDSTQSGLAVTSPTNTGHAASSAQILGAAGLQARSWRCSGFPASAGIALSATLKITHTTDGALAGLSKTNTCRVQYSVDNGSNWTSVVSRTDFTSAQGPTTASISLTLPQDFSQVQVRDFMSVNTLPDGGSATATVTISSVQIEVTTQDAQLLTMM